MKGLRVLFAAAVAFSSVGASNMPQANEDPFPNTFEIRLIGGPHPVEVTVRSEIEAGPGTGTEEATAHVSSIGWPQTSLFHNGYGTGVIQASTEHGEISHEFQSRDPDGMTWRYTLIMTLQAHETLVISQSTLTRPILEAEFTVEGSGVSVESRIIGGAGVIRVDDAQGEHIALTAGGVAHGIGYHEIDFAGPVMVSPAVDDCIDGCSYFTYPPDGTERWAGVRGNPNLGGRSVSTDGGPADTIGPAGRWRMEWGGVYANESIYRNLPTYYPPESPAVFIYLPADWFPERT
jgi:hypothetical protein